MNASGCFVVGKLKASAPQQPLSRLQRQLPSQGSSDRADRVPPLKGEVPAARAVWFGNTEFGNSICPAAIEEYSSQTSVGVWGERKAEQSLPQPARVGNADQ